MNDSPKLISDFNEAAFQIQRLNYIWQSCNNLAYSGRLKDWNWQLDRAYIELSNDMWDEDGIQFSQDEKSYYQKIKGINRKISKNWNNKENLYELLNLKEQILRNLQDASGKGGRKKSEGEDLMD